MHNCCHWNTLRLRCIIYMFSFENVFLLFLFRSYINTRRQMNTPTHGRRPVSLRTHTPITRTNTEIKIITDGRTVVVGSRLSSPVSRLPSPATCAALIDGTLLRFCIVFAGSPTIRPFGPFASRENDPAPMIPRWIPRLVRLAGVLVLAVFEDARGSTGVTMPQEPSAPIDVVRASTVGDNSRFKCSEENGSDDENNMPLVFWHRASMEPRCALLQSLSAQNVTFKRGKSAAGWWKISHRKRICLRHV